MNRAQRLGHFVDEGFGLGLELILATCHQLMAKMRKLQMTTRTCLARRITFHFLAPKSFCISLLTGQL